MPRQAPRGSRPSHLRYLWAHPYGRLAILCAFVGAVGLLFHYWSALPLLLAVPKAPGGRLW